MFCKSRLGKKYCVDSSPTMSCVDIIEYVMEGFQKNNAINDGIKKVYRYSSPSNKDMNGPLESFIKMIKSSTYHHLLNCKDWNYINDSEYRTPDDIEYSVLVYIKSNIDNNRYIYRFNLSRQYDFMNDKPLYDRYHKINLNLYWRIDNIILERIGGDLIEEFDNNKNIYGEDLSVCSLDPMTGYYRDGKCRTDSNDVGTHTVCTRVSDEFLDFTKRRGNDLSTARGSFPGLKDGDSWCLCALRYKEAYDNNIKMKVKKGASHIKSLEYLNKNQL
jgi:uncharacterized protein (DUF2237 family)